MAVEDASVAPFYGFCVGRSSSRCDRFSLIVDEPSIRPSMHIFVGSKAPWFEITDALPQFDGFPDRG